MIKKLFSALIIVLAFSCLGQAGERYSYKCQCLGSKVGKRLVSIKPVTGYGDHDFSAKLNAQFKCDKSIREKLNIYLPERISLRLSSCYGPVKI